MSTPDGQNDPLSPLESPSTPISPDDMPSPSLEAPQRATNQITSSAMSNITASNTSSGLLANARRPQVPQPSRSVDPEILNRMNKFTLGRQKNAGPMSPGPVAQSPGPVVSGFPSSFDRSVPSLRPNPRPSESAPSVPRGSAPMSLAAKRGINLPGRLPGGLPGAAPAATPAGGKRPKPQMKLPPPANGGPPAGEKTGMQNGDFAAFPEMFDAEGRVKFGSITVHGEGVDFAKSGKSFRMSLDEVEPYGELGKGNYGTVYVVRHSKPKFRKQWQGLSGSLVRDAERTIDSNQTQPVATQDAASPDAVQTPTTTVSEQAHGASGPTGKVMAMKEMRLELDNAKFQTIVMELDVLHRCVSPYIVDFYGAFFQEGAVYICMEFMDGGSIDKLYGDGVPENVLRKITYATTLGLKALKEDHNIIHRDVKPTNILVNTRGLVKICDFGVSGNLVASIAKTNIGCQSYMAPERISSGGMAQSGAGAGTYSVQSDIWSLGLTIIECALGQYPYPPETYDNIFSQLAAIVDGAPPDLPADKFSPAARDFTAGCLNKIPNLRPTYPLLLRHAWLAALANPSPIKEEDEDAAVSTPSSSSTAEPSPSSSSSSVDPALAATGATSSQSYDREVAEWVIDALERRASGTMGKSTKPALHTAPLDAAAVSPSNGAVQA